MFNKANAILHTLTVAATTGVAPNSAMSVYAHGERVLSYRLGAPRYFDLASLTKLYTTTAFLAQVQDGLATLHTPLADVVPEFARVSPRPIGGGQDPHTAAPLPPDPAYVGFTVNPQTVTAWHLLTHTSGLPAWRDVYTLDAPPPPQIPVEEEHRRWQLAVERLCAYPFVAPPETGVRYSDIGLMLLGEMVRRLDNAPSLADAIRARVSEAVLYHPLRHGVALTDIAPTEYDGRFRLRRLRGEVHDENAAGVGGVAGHAGLFAMADDVAAFGNLWLTDPAALGLTPELVAEAVRLQAGTPEDGRGLGWMRKSPTDSSAGDGFSMASYGHTGFTGTSLWIDPTRALVVALLTNRVYGGRERVGIHALRRQIHDQVVEAYG
jgi:CubicO group peptidase (beta-lactamase class C family)